MENDVPHVYLLGKTYLMNNERFYIRNDPIIHMAAGHRHTIIVTESGRVFSFGGNNSGQLGLGHTDATEKVSCIKSLKFDGTGEKVILAACGRESSLVATNQGSLYAFGSNYCYQLGIESDEFTIIHPYPVKIEHFPSKMSWKQLSMGAEHTCVLTNDGKVYVWSSNAEGQCGLARKYDIIRTPTELKLEYPVTSISCGYYHTALITEDGRLFLFGNHPNRQIECSTPDQYIGPLEISLPDPVKAVACGNEHTVVLTEKGDVYTCGQGDRGQLGLGRRVSIAKEFEIIKNLPKHVTMIAAGEGHTAIVDSHGNIYVFGDNKHHKLSSEIYSNKFEPYFIDKFKEYNVLKVVCGGCQTVILAEKKSIKNKDDIESMQMILHQSILFSSSDKTDSETKSIENVCHINRNLMATKSTNSTDEKLNTNSFLDCESISDPDESLVSMKNAFMDIIHAEINIKLQPKKISFKFDHTDTTDENNCALSDEKSFTNDTKLNSTNNLRKKQSFNDEISSADERSFVIFEQTVQGKLSNESDLFRTPLSSTNSGRTSSSISSIPNEDALKAPESNNNLQSDCHLPITETLATSNRINSNIDSTKKPQVGFFSRIFGPKSSQNLSIATNTNSKICSIM